MTRHMSLPCNTSGIPYEYENVCTCTSQYLPRTKVWYLHLHQEKTLAVQHRVGCSSTTAYTYLYTYNVMLLHRCTPPYPYLRSRRCAQVAATLCALPPMPPLLCVPIYPHYIRYCIYVACDQKWHHAYLLHVTCHCFAHSERYSYY